jgi:hypothetical protein
MNPNISQKAWDLYNRTDDVSWEKGCINEHQEPISHVWTWILQNKDVISPADILVRAKKWPMVTVTKDEDNAITEKGYRSNGDPEERHIMIALGPKGPPKKRGRSAPSIKDEQ